jgi:hypothetical protein
LEIYFETPTTGPRREVTKPKGGTNHRLVALNLNPGVSIYASPFADEGRSITMILD